MKKDTARLDNMRIASPCPVGWEQMAGDERVRRCDLCEMHVYDISRMSRREAESLIANSAGRICTRLFRRADGTIMTRDCPVGLRAIKRRVTKTTGAVFAAIMTLCASVAGQNPSRKSPDSCAPRINRTTRASDSPAQTGTFVLQVFDVNGAVVAGADITISDSIVKPKGTDTKNRSWPLTSDDEGRIDLPGLAKGIYDLKIEQPGFKTFILNKVRLGAKEIITVEITLTVSPGTSTVGLLDMGPSVIDTPPGTTIINRKMIESCRTQNRHMIQKCYQNGLALILLASLLFLSSIVAQAQPQTQRPLTSQELVRLVYQLPAHPEKRDEIAEAIRTRGLGFPLTAGLRSLVATKSGNDALLRRTLEEAERRRLNPIAAALPPEAEGVELLEKTRAATMAALEKMPDFLVKQQITRSQAFGGTNNWRSVDRLSIAVSYRASAGEQYKLLAINGQPPATEAREGSDYSGKLGGATSTGEYVSMLTSLFRPESQSTFRMIDTDLLRGRRTIVYEYIIKKEFSRSTLGWSDDKSTKLETIVGSRGRMWVDRESNRVLRLEHTSTEIRPDFPITAASNVVDYAWVTINEQQHLLPSRAIMEMTDRRRAQTYQTRNDILFRGYRKFGSELKIIDIDDKDFAPEEPEKTPPPDKPVKSDKP